MLFFQITSVFCKNSNLGLFAFQWFASVCIFHCFAYHCLFVNFCFFILEFALGFGVCCIYIGFNDWSICNSWYLYLPKYFPLFVSLQFNDRPLCVSSDGDKSRLPIAQENYTLSAFEATTNIAFVFFIGICIGSKIFLEINIKSCARFRNEVKTFTRCNLSHY